MITGNNNKRIVICADGTWNRPEKNLKEDFPTNVLRLALLSLFGDWMGVRLRLLWLFKIHIP